MIEVTNLIGGAHVPPVGGEYLDDLNPATGEAVARVPDSDARDIDSAVDAASAAFSSWSATAVEERSRCLLHLADLIEGEQNELARLESVDTGKPVTLARRLDIPRAVANFRFFATAVLHASTESAQHRYGQ